MPYTIRNTLILLVLLVIVIMGGCIGNASSSKKLEELEKERAELVKRVSNLKKEMSLSSSQDQLEDVLKELEKKTSESNKLIALEDNPTITYRYLMDICNKYCPAMIFDFRQAKSGKIIETSYNEYTITGEVPMKSLYAFIYQIENQPRLYTVESINVREQSLDSDNKLNFSLTLRTYFYEDGVEIKDIPVRSLGSENIRYNPFFPGIHKPLRSEKEEKYLNVDGAILTGLTPNMAFLSGKDGMVKTLSPGDKVAYGYLWRINWEEQSVTFRINKIGITTKKTIYMRKGVQ